MVSKKVKLFYFVRFFQNNLVKLNYIFKNKSINIGSNIIFCALFNDIFFVIETTVDRNDT